MVQRIIKKFNMLIYSTCYVCDGVSRFQLGICCLSVGSDITGKLDCI
jgi:hypothetical protein